MYKDWQHSKKKEDLSPLKISKKFSGIYLVSSLNDTFFKTPRSWSDSVFFGGNACSYIIKTRMFSHDWWADDQTNIIWPWSKHISWWMSFVSCSLCWNLQSMLLDIFLFDQISRLPALCPVWIVLCCMCI